MNKKLETTPSKPLLGVGGGSSLRNYEYIHIPLWLLKDTCWLMEWKTLGIAMIIPTIGVAIAITVKTFRDESFWINLAICCWIIANSFWMGCEFFEREELRYYSAIPFVLGFVCVGWFYGKRWFVKKQSGLEHYF